MSSPLVTWLHLTDFHQGVKHQRHLFPQVKSLFFADLQELRDRRGLTQIDLVLFTGDLTQQGKPEEFAQFSLMLKELSQRIKDLFGSEPLFVCVPGNHDMTWPERPSPAFRMLIRWQQEAAVRDEYFAEDAGQEYRDVVDTAFLPYQEFVESLPMHKLWRKQPCATVPGDFALTFTRGGFRLAVVGLNSAYLHLAKANFQGRLDLDPRQLESACPDAPAWLAGHDAALLLTHHPLEWLEHERSIPQFRTEIYPEGRFALHLHGHNHQPKALQVSEFGGKPRHSLLGASLFSNEEWLDEKGNLHKERIHGYSAGWLEEEGPGLRVTLWPRKLLVGQEGSPRFVPDQDFHVEEQSGCVSVHAARLRPKVGQSSPMVGSSRMTPRRQTIPPPTAFDPAYYVHRPGIEQAARSHLRQPGQPAVLHGPRGLGKSQVLLALCHAARTGQLTLSETGGTPFVIALNLRLIRDELRQKGSPLAEEPFFRAVADRIRIAMGIEDAALADHWNASAPAVPYRLTSFVSSLVLPLCPKGVLLAIDQAEAIVADSYRDTFFHLLRNWAERSSETSSWSLLRLLLSTRVSPGNLVADPNISPFNLTSPIEIGDFEPEEIIRLFELHTTSLPMEALQKGQSLIGGHPAMWRQLAYNAYNYGRPFSEMLQEGPQGAFENRLIQIREELERRGLLAATLRIFKQQDVHNIDTLRRLVEEGIITLPNPRATKGELRYPLYHRLFVDR